MFGGSGQGKNGMGDVRWLFGGWKYDPYEPLEVSLQVMHRGIQQR